MKFVIYDTGSYETLEEAKVNGGDYTFSCKPEEEAAVRTAFATFVECNARPEDMVLVIDSE